LLSTIRQTFLKSDLHTRLQAAADAPAADASPEGAPQTSAAAPTELWPGPTERSQVADWFKPAPAVTPRLFDTPSAAGTSAPPRAWDPPEPEWVQRMPPPAPAGESRFNEFQAAVDPDATPKPNGHHPPARSLQLHDSYLVVEAPEGMIVIDQHALHERILFEELRARLAAGALESQRLLVPVAVELAAVDAALLSEKSALLARLGIEVESLSGGTVLVSALPVMLAGADPETLVRDLADRFRESPLDPAPDALLDHVLSTLACKAAVKAGQRLSPEEIDALLARRHLADNTHHCPHGRPTALVFSKADLERQFGRT
ncbi:MAG: DNA mismatch repair protein MutL, partial [Thermoleophilia bacterium]|nr:DNA mismatch repair protein MutL [Thermoleophilia bacterium]